LTGVEIFSGKTKGKIRSVTNHRGSTEPAKTCWVF
jgi:hypothetical protein